MFEVECPWCQEPVRVEAAVVSAAESAVRCDGCSVVVKIGDPPEPRALAIAA